MFNFVLIINIRNRENDDGSHREKLNSHKYDVANGTKLSLMYFLCFSSSTLK